MGLSIWQIIGMIIMVLVLLKLIVFSCKAIFHIWKNEK